MRLQLMLAAVSVSLALSSHPVLAQSGALAGSVNADSALKRALAGADIAIPALGLTTRSNFGGDYRIGGVPPGRYLVTVSLAGYKSIGDSVTVAAGRENFWDFVLATRVTVLDSVVTTAKSPLREYTTVRLREFEQRRKEGFGHFIAEEELRRNDHEKVSDIIAARVPGVEVVRLGASRMYLSSARLTGATLSGGSDASGKLKAQSDPMLLRCYPDIYLDGVRLAPAEDPVKKALVAVDISQFAVNELAGVEFHAGAATTPSRFNTLGQGCGQLMLWSREK